MHQSSTTNLDKYYSFYRSIGSPKFIVAPMVDQSELAYRLLTRKYKAELCYTPMFHSRLFAESEGYRKSNFTPCQLDRPLCVQFCGNDPEILLKAAKFVENDCDAVDINLGCPQGIAKKGKYGSFLLEKTQLIVSMVETLSQNLKVPVTCKIRCLPTELQTLSLAKAIQQAGCSLLVVHGRTKEQKKNDTGACNWEIIRKVKEALQIPVIANGGMASYKDCLSCLEYTGCDGVMVSESILEYPALFDPSQNPFDLDQLALEFLDVVESHPGESDIKNIRSHCHKFLYTGLNQFPDLRQKLVDCQALEQVRQVVLEMKERRKNVAPQDKLGWYYRYWKSMNLNIEQTKTFNVSDWDEQVKNDPLFNKKKSQKESKKSEQMQISESIFDKQEGQNIGLGLFLGNEEEEDQQVIASNENQQQSSS